MNPPDPTHVSDRELGSELLRRLSVCAFSPWRRLSFEREWRILFFVTAIV